MNKFRKAAVGVLLAVSMLSTVFAGCGKPDGTKAAITVNGETLNMGAATFFLRYQQAQTTNMLVQYGMASEGAIWNQVYTEATSTSEAQTYGDTMKDSAQETLVDMMLQKQHAEEYGVTIPENIAAEIETTKQSVYDKNAEKLDALGITADDIGTVLELMAYQSLTYDPMVEDTDREVSDEEAAQKKITYARTKLTSYDSATYTSSEVTEDQKKTFMIEMQLLLTNAVESEDPAAFDFSAEADAIDEEIFCSTYSYGADDDIFPEEVTSAVDTLKDGEVYNEIIDTGDYYYIVRLDAAFDEEATNSKKEEIISARESDNYNEKLKNWSDAAEITTSKDWDKLTVTDNDGFMQVTATSSETAEEAVEASSAQAVVSSAS